MRIFVFIFLLLVISAGGTFAQRQLPYPPNLDIQKQHFDTLCYKLHFDEGDTLIYNILSYDSISINYDKPLKRIRLEKYRIVCEEVDRNNRFHLVIELIEYHAKEAYKSEQNTDITDSPWLNRKVKIIIDSVGDRYSLPQSKPDKYATAPGGPFQPLMFFPFLRSCKPINSTWIVQSTDTLVENGNPVPLMKQTSLFRLHPVADTMGWKCAKLEYVSTGQGVMLSEKAGFNMNVTAVTNGYGQLFLSLERNVPVFLFTTVEQKLTIYLPDNKTQPGRHSISSYYSLESISKREKGTKSKKKIKKN